MYQYIPVSWSLNMAFESISDLMQKSNFLPLCASCRFFSENFQQLFVEFFSYCSCSLMYGKQSKVNHQEKFVARHCYSSKLLGSLASQDSGRQHNTSWSQMVYCIGNVVWVSQSRFLIIKIGTQWVHVSTAVNKAGWMLVDGSRIRQPVG